MKYLYHYREEARAIIEKETVILSNTIEQMAIDMDIVENGKDAIILRALNNYYCFYSSTIQDAIFEVQPYGFSQKDVKDVYDKNSIQRRKEIHDFCYGT